MDVVKPKARNTDPECNLSICFFSGTRFMYWRVTSRLFSFPPSLSIRSNLHTSEYMKIVSENE